MVDESIFAQIDAFVLRCRDLLSVCSGQVHFARKNGSEKRGLPVLRGADGTQFARSLEGIEKGFNVALDRLRKSRDIILDVTSPTWHEAHGEFKSSIKELEV